MLEAKKISKFIPCFKLLQIFHYEWDYYFLSPFLRTKAALSQAFPLIILIVLFFRLVFSSLQPPTNLAIVQRIFFFLQIV